MNFASEYIKYLVNAKGRHGIHSPFVYDFVDCCLRIKPDEAFLKSVQSLKKKLSQDNREIEIHDAGAGSKKLGKVRKVNQIYRTASSKGVYADLLYQLTSHYKPQHVLELGTSLGIGTLYLASGNNFSKIVSVDACSKTSQLAQANISAFQLSNVEFVQATFLEYLRGCKDLKFDLVYIDGHHDGDALKQYVQILLPLTTDDTIFVLDDIRWSNSMWQAWNELKASSIFHVSLDLFRMGILIRRPQQVKEHFVVKLNNVLTGF